MAEKQSDSLSESFQRQHLLLTQKLQSCEKSWELLSDLTQDLQSAPELSGSFKPDKDISTAAKYYLAAKKSEFLQSPPVKLSIFYPIFLLIFSSFILVLFITRILPSFQSVYSNTGAMLPSFTSLILEYNTWFLCIMLMMIITIFIVCYHINQAMKNMQQLPRWLTVTGIFNTWSNTYNNFVTGQQLQAWYYCGLKLATEQISPLLSSQEWELAKKNQLEIQTLIAVTPKLDPLQNYQINQKINLVLTLLIAIFIGALIIAMYLPIFQLGSVS